jgi:hypothetical protein
MVAGHSEKTTGIINFSMAVIFTSARKAAAKENVCSPARRTYLGITVKLFYNPACEPISTQTGEGILSNLIQDEYLPTSKTSGYRTMRGVWVRSRGEHMIDNWFAEHGIVTYYEKAIYLDSIRIVPDWYIPSIKIYVEFLGLKGDSSYDNMWKQKEKTYNKHGVKYITLDENDLVELDRSIPMKLPELKLKGLR